MKSAKRLALKHYSAICSVLISLFGAPLYSLSEFAERNRIF